jgi:hypothetical protein
MLADSAQRNPDRLQVSGGHAKPCGRDFARSRIERRKIREQGPGYTGRNGCRVKLGGRACGPRRPFTSSSLPRRIPKAA